MANLTPRHKYHRIIVGVVDQVHDEDHYTPVLVDVYDVLEAYKVTCPALQHLIKKALCVGLRGYKDTEQDLKDILDSAQEAIRLHHARQLTQGGAEDGLDVRPSEHVTNYPYAMTIRACRPRPHRPAAEQEDLQPEQEDPLAQHGTTPDDQADQPEAPQTAFENAPMPDGANAYAKHDGKILWLKLSEKDGVNYWGSLGWNFAGQYQVNSDHVRDVVRTLWALRRMDGITIHHLRSTDDITIHHRPAEAKTMPDV